MICISDMFLRILGMSTAQIEALRSLDPRVAIVTPCFSFNAGGGWHPPGPDGSKRRQKEWLQLEPEPSLLLVGMGDRYGDAGAIGATVREICLTPDDGVRAPSAEERAILIEALEGRDGVEPILAALAALSAAAAAAQEAPAASLPVEAER